jgi:hypothetical protein
VLLFQDIAVIPMLAVFPLLAPARGAARRRAAETATWVSGLRGGRRRSPCSARWRRWCSPAGSWCAALPAIARTGLREIFTAAALALVVGTALLMTQVGLSPALGTFLAGVVLATSEYRHELEGDIEPFKGLLLGLFFISVGATVNFALVAARRCSCSGSCSAWCAQARDAGRAARRGQPRLRPVARPAAARGVRARAGGEFAFVLFAFAERERVLTPAQTAPLVAAVALSMALTPLVLLAYERVVRPRVGTREAAAPARARRRGRRGGEAIIVGFGEFGATVGRLLRANGVPTTVLDVDSDRVELLRSLGVPVYYGDATRSSCSRRPGARRARLLVVALGSAEATLRVAREARREFPSSWCSPRLRVGRRARPRRGGRRARVPRVARHGAAARRRRAAAGGMRAHSARRAAQRFLRHDEESLGELTAAREDRARYLGAARRRIEDLERLLLADLERRDEDGRDSGWDAESLREEVQRGALTGGRRRRRVPPRAGGRRSRPPRRTRPPPRGKTA